MPHRFFISPGWITPPTVTLRGNTARQISTVLRMQPGDEIMVLDNAGTAWRVLLTQFNKDSVQGQIVDQQPAQGEATLRLWLYQGTLKGQKFEWVLQKGTELGIARFVPTLCQRSVVRKPADLTKKYSRWQQIIQEAAEQSGRGRLPALADPLTLPEALTQAASEAERLLMPWEETADESLKTVLAQGNMASLALFIGPEGGFAAEEAAQAKAMGGRLVTLGPRILRAETAGLAAAAAIFFATGEWD